SSTTVTLPSPRHPVPRSPRHRFKVGAAVLLSAALLAFTIWYGASYVRGRLEATPERTTSPPALGDIPVIGGDTGPFSSVAFSPDARRALVAGPDHVLQLWDLSRGKEITRLPGHFHTLLALHTAAHGERAVSTGKDQMVLVWDLVEPRRLRVCMGHNATVRGVHFIWDSRHAAAADESGRILMWNTDVATVGSELRKNPFGIRSINLEKFGRFAVTANSDGTLRVWDLEPPNQRQTCSLTVPGVEPTCAIWSRDQRFLLSGSTDGSVRLWRVTTERQLARFEGHSSPVTCLAMTPDNRLALSGSADRTVRLWDVATGNELACFRGHTDDLLAVAFGSNELALSGSKDGTLRFWRLPEGLPTKPTGYSERVGAMAIAPNGKIMAAAVGD